MTHSLLLPSYSIGRRGHVWGGHYHEEVVFTKIMNFTCSLHQCGLSVPCDGPKLSGDQYIVNFVNKP